MRIVRSTICAVIIVRFALCAVPTCAVHILPLFFCFLPRIRCAVRLLQIMAAVNLPPDACLTVVQLQRMQTVNRQRYWDAVMR